MATALTLHAIDEPLSRKLADYANRTKKSLNQSAKDLLASALGLASPARTDHAEDLERFVGAWDGDTADRLRRAANAFSQIDEELWK